ncbi:hypothetical protein ACMU_18625 [Actibacterium mucosum KCTC 23349]|uniref:LuxR family transcriptional regulator n=1 Tax=Actibacterium mucosum KCTC 23349 TaxID=1454373 RepID=A0A037ZDM5_9RHOB|nr:response regulator [Actibacterium mucosum]KAJ54242.1 hypothetical protein ACMU_18625 [Actibacterium mucosum KCTC 23349]
MKRFEFSDHNIALVVDDNPEALGFVSAALEEIGMTVLVARDGQAAIDLATRVQPDVIMMDAIMPGMDGFETTRALKSPPIATDAPIIFMTGLTERENIIKGLESGGVDYLTKPVEIEEMVARVTVHMLNSKMMRSAREALDSFGRAVLALGPEGRIIWGSPGAMQLLSARGLPGDTAPISVAGWLQNASALPVSQAPGHDAEGLQFSYIGRASSGEALVRLTEQNADSPGDRLASEFSLTGREGEVLYWLSQGKTNRDIAEILSLSARTINKHLEQIFQKLGVDNRTSAAVLADRFLSQRK